LFYLVYVYEAYQPYSLTFISSIHSPIVAIFQFSLSLLIPKSMFQGVSRCFHTVSTLHFGQFNPFHCSPLPFPPIPHYSTAFNTYCFILYLHRCNVFRYCWLSHSRFFSLLLGQTLLFKFLFVIPYQMVYTAYFSVFSCEICIQENFSL
jgi:hypothetical protein